MNHANWIWHWIDPQPLEFKVMNSLSTPRPKTKNEYYWYFVPCINMKEDEDTYAFNRILNQYGAKLKWEIRKMGWCWFPSLNVYGMTLVFFPLVLNCFSVEQKLFNKVCDPLMFKFNLFFHKKESYCGTELLITVNKYEVSCFAFLLARPESILLRFWLQNHSIQFCQITHCLSRIAVVENFIEF